MMTNNGHKTLISVSLVINSHDEVSTDNSTDISNAVALCTALYDARVELSR